MRHFVLLFISQLQFQILHTDMKSISLSNATNWLKVNDKRTDSHMNFISVIHMHYVSQCPSLCTAGPGPGRQSNHTGSKQRGREVCHNKKENKCFSKNVELFCKKLPSAIQSNLTDGDLHLSPAERHVVTFALMALRRDPSKSGHIFVTSFHKTDVT